VQGEQLATQREQLENQQALSAEQTAVLKLQATELGQSIEDRQREAEERRAEQASKVAAWYDQATITDRSGAREETRSILAARVRNDSDLPIYSVRVFFHQVAAVHEASEDYTLVDLGGPPARIRTMPPGKEEVVATGDSPISGTSSKRNQPPSKD
jgi:vacuolar-type H+-ATPase subunit I/STV1